VKSPSPASDENSPRAQPVSGKRLTTLLGLVLASVTLILFWPVTGYDFVVMDDGLYVYDNAGVTRGLSLAGLHWAFTNIHAGYWIPLTWISLMLDHSLYGLFAGGYHLTNLLLHALNALLLFAALKRMTRALWPSALVAALFAWHPLHVESVAWVTERKDVLSTLFLLLTILAYTRYAEKPSAPKLAAALLFFILGLMAKPMLVTLPLVLLLLDFWPLQRLPSAASPGGRRQAQTVCLRLLLEKIPFLIVSLAISVATMVTQHQGGGIPSLTELPLSFRAANALASYTAYLWKTICPLNLCAYYPLSSLPAFSVLASALVLAGVTGLVFRRRRRSPWLITGWLWYVLVLFPVSGLVQSGGQAMADRFTYVPLIGIFIMIAWSADHWLALRPALRPWGLGVFGLLLVLCATLTWHQLPYWRDSISLFTRALAVTEKNAFAENNLGAALSNAGRAREAIGHYQEALRLEPNNRKARYNLGVELAGQGKPAAAAGHFSELLKQDPANEQLLNNLGAVLAQAGKPEAAIEQFRQAIHIKPAYPKPYLNCGLALRKLGQNEPAYTNFMMALQLCPDDLEVLHQTSVFLATCPDAKWRQPAEALRLALRANQLSRPETPAALRTLALAFASNGNYSNAVATAELAREKARGGNWPELAARITEELAAYRNGRIPPVNGAIPAIGDTQP
jgi:protein O-mannosyl-transferase